MDSVELPDDSQRFVAGVAGLVHLGIQIRKGRASSPDVLREEWIQAVDAEATAVRQQFTLAISVQATEVVDHLTDNLDRYREHLEESSDFIRERIAQPENRARQEVVDQLEPLCGGGREFLAALRELETPDTRP
ncbi:hypothetical protein [Streptomyces sp. NPDC059828]|uniref:hypothetical protein n=1 Tax=Streptomyces sp. NPDC059828 TaxID=3346965 RepID=UPI00365F2C37